MLCSAFLTLCVYPDTALTFLKVGYALLYYINIYILLYRVCREVRNETFCRNLEVGACAAHAVGIKTIFFPDPNLTSV